MTELQYALQDGLQVEFKENANGEKYAVWQVKISDSESYQAIYFLSKEEVTQFKNKYELLEKENNFEKIYEWLENIKKEFSLHEQKEMDSRVIRIINSLNKKYIGEVVEVNLDLNTKSNDLNGIVKCSNGTFEIWNSKATSKYRIHYRLQISRK